jgi:hypothetical protein
MSSTAIAETLENDASQIEGVRASGVTPAGGHAQEGSR